MQFRDNYAFLSNMFLHPVYYNGETYPCAETAFQVSKCTNPAEKELFKVGKDYVYGATAKRIGRTVALRSGWEKQKPWIMLDIIRAKFSDPVLKSMLSNTTEELVEDNNWGDKYWGKCNGEGENMLGRILMYVRKELQNAAS